MAEDTIHYFRIEARELLAGLSEGVLGLEKGRPEDLARLLRYAHTLKGAARVVGQNDIGALAHAFEEALDAGTAGMPASPPRIRELLARLDVIAEHVSALFPVPGPATGGAPGGGPVDTVRVELREMDALLSAVHVVGARLAGLKRPIEELEGAQRRVQSIEAKVRTHPARAWTRGELNAHVRLLLDELSETLERCRNDLTDARERSEGELFLLHDRAQRMRLLPAGVLFSALDRAARDAAAELGKSVSFAATGDDVRVGSHVLDLVKEALLHAVRNAVAHGIEAPRVRATLGKPEEGQIRVSVERRAEGVVVCCSDDGAGLDVAEIGRAAARRGLLDPTEIQSLTLDRAVAILAGGGVSTRERADLVAGRGIGLNAVSVAVARAHGRWTVRSEPGVGATVEIRVPLTLTSLLALEVRVGTREVWIPAEAVKRTAHVLPSAVVRTEGHAAILEEGAAVPLISLPVLLAPSGPPPLPAAPRERSLSGAERGEPVVIVEAEGRRVAVRVDALVGLRTILMHPLPAGLEDIPLVSGTTLDAEGHPELVLDPAGLVRARTPGSGRERLAGPRRPVLVVDDSLTTRLLEQSILETAGYEVHLAVNAEDALLHVRERTYGLVLVDVEMPGMDGFSFVAAVRADPTLAHTACILVTSRSGPADAARGSQVGAAGLIGKDEFDQTEFLALVRRLVG
jgi:two-component system chemotaxis sensor kinase CheA